MDEDTKILIQSYLSEAYRIYLQKCFENKEEPNPYIREYFKEKIEDLC